MKNETDTVGRIMTHLVPWISEKMPGAEHLVISGVEKPGMGLSNETYLFTLNWEEAGEKKMRQMVLRASPSERVFPDYHLEHQFLVMKALKGSGVPVPEMFWMEKEARVIGAPFYLMERLNGTMPKDYPSYHGSGMFFDLAGERRSEIWNDSVDTLARINMIDWKARGLDFLGVPGPGTGPIDLQLAYWKRYLDWVKSDPAEEHPVLERALVWLEENRYEPDRVGLCWGDARVGNILYGEPGHDIVAVLDWEMAFLGDPEADLAWFIFIDRYLHEEYGLPRLGGLPTAGETVTRYEKLTGWKVRHFKYNEIFAALRFGMILVSVIKKLMSQGMHNYSHMLQGNYCVRFLAAELGMPVPGGNQAQQAPADGGRVTIQFDFSGPGGGHWYIVNEGGSSARHEGSVEKPSCRVRASADDWRALQTGELNQIEAWKTGRLVVDGDLNVMIRLKEDIARLQS